LSKTNLLTTEGCLAAGYDGSAAHTIQISDCVTSVFDLRLLLSQFAELKFGLSTDYRVKPK